MDTQRKPLYETLQHRDVYDRVGGFARTKAVFRHTTDEWFEFLQHDKRVFGVAAATLAIGVMVSGFWSGWDVTVRSVLPSLVIALVPTVMLAIFVYVWCFLKAPNELCKRRLWRDLQTANATVASMTAENDALRLASDRSVALRTLPDRLRQLADEIYQFIAYRNGIPVGPGGMMKNHELGPVFAIEAAMQEVFEAGREQDAETRTLYSRMFADRVIAARDEIRRAFPDERLDDYKQPTDFHSMAAAAEWLKVVAARLP